MQHFIPIYLFHENPNYLHPVNENQVSDIKFLLQHIGRTLATV